MNKPLRILVCGSRSWTDVAAITRAIDGHPRGTVFISGAARGADQMAERVAMGLGYHVVSYPAEWRGKGKRAGIVRNLEMLDSKPDKVIAFWDGASTGTAHTIGEARRRGIPVEIILADDGEEDGGIGVREPVVPKPPTLEAGVAFDGTDDSADVFATRTTR